MNKVYTIGYSAYSVAEFIAVLKRYGINAVADVRTLPYSHYRPEFNQNSLAEELRRNQINYVFLGQECGARPPEQSCYVNGQVSFTTLSQTKRFIDGLKRLQNGAKRWVIAIMCAEQDPICCHRYMLVARELCKYCPDIEIVNILADGKLESKNETETRLLQLHKLDQEEFPGFGRSFTERLSEAYAKQGERIAYQVNDIAQEQYDH